MYAFSLSIRKRGTAIADSSPKTSIAIRISTNVKPIRRERMMTSKDMDQLWIWH
jgi:hypothetical protein